MLSASGTDNRAGSQQIRVDYQRLLLDHLDLIDHIVRTTGRRRHLSAAEQEDFGGFVRLRLLEDDYAVLRKFQNRSALRTYLAAVIERLSLDFCVERWGRWRPSAVAERLGAVAVSLERLINRDGHTLDEAVEIILTNPETAMSSRQVLDMWEQLPARVRTSEVSEDAAAGVSSSQTSDTSVDDGERQASIERLERTLQTAFEAIAAQDRVVLGLRFDQDLSMIEIAKLTGVSVPTLHRRLDRTVKDLRRALTAAGFDPREVAELIGHSSIVLSPLLRAEVERFLGPVRLTKQDG
ncbi:MAG: RNA polymerase sigma factor [Vicinamibacterales bacterium]